MQEKENPEEVQTGKETIVEAEQEQIATTWKRNIMNCLRRKREHEQGIEKGFRKCCKLCRGMYQLQGK